MAALGLGLAVALAAGCQQDLDVGNNRLGILPAPPGSSAILINDSFNDNWCPEFAALFANNGGPKLAGIVVNATQYWPDLDANVAGWNDFVAAARASQMEGLPDVTRSDAPPFVVPPDRQIASTVPQHSNGAELIVLKSRELSLPWRPLVIISGSQLTDIADAYLIDPTVVERVVVVAQLGAYSDSRGLMTGPNGDLDPWADWIVAQKFRYAQVSAYYDQTGDVTVADVPNLPKNRLGAWMAAKRTKLSSLPTAADQEPILALAAPDFVATIVTTTPDLSGGFEATFGQGPPLVPNVNGNTWVVARVNPPSARQNMWRMLSNPDTFKP